MSECVRDIKALQEAFKETCEAYEKAKSDLENYKTVYETHKRRVEHLMEENRVLQESVDRKQRQMLEQVILFSKTLKTI